MKIVGRGVGGDIRDNTHVYPIQIYRRQQGQQELGVSGANGSSSMKGSRLQTSNTALATPPQ